MVCSRIVVPALAVDHSARVVLHPFHCWVGAGRVIPGAGMDVGVLGGLSGFGDHLARRLGWGGFRKRSLDCFLDRSEDEWTSE